MSGSNVNAASISRRLRMKIVPTLNLDIFQILKMIRVINANITKPWNSSPRLRGGGN